MQKLVLIAAIVLTILSCKEDKPVTLNGKDLSKDILEVKDLPIPESCEFLSTKWIANEMDLDPELVGVKNGGATEGSSGCFFRWSTNERPNAGIFIQIFTNPIEEETNKWASGKIAGMLAGGAGTSTNNEVGFKELQGLGDGGAYSDQLSQYHWRIGENYTFLLAFNLDNMSESDKLSLAKKVGEEVMTNFKASIQ